MLFISDMHMESFDFILNFFNPVFKYVSVTFLTYLEPEIAHVGKYEDELNKNKIEFEVYKRNLADVDRCLCDGVSKGFVKIIVRAGK